MTGFEPGPTTWLAYAQISSNCPSKAASARANSSSVPGFAVRLIGGGNFIEEGVGSNAADEDANGAATYKTTME